MAGAIESLLCWQEVADNILRVFGAMAGRKVAEGSPMDCHYTVRHWSHVNLNNRTAARAHAVTYHVGRQPLFCAVSVPPGDKPMPIVCRIRKMN